MRTIVGMAHLLWILLYGALAVSAVMLVALVVLWRVLRRRLRVHPKTASTAPVHWNLATSQAAQAHRRLRNASQAALKGTLGQSAFVEFGESIAQQGVDIEHDLVLASRTPRPMRANALLEPIAAVKRLEATVAELATTSAQWRQTMNSPGQPDSLTGVQERLAALRQASDEVGTLLSQPVLPPATSNTTTNSPLDERTIQIEG
jgi:hypothetical protein